VYLALKDAKNAEDQFEAALLVDSSNSDGRSDWRKAQIQQSDSPALCPISKRSPNPIRETPPPCACWRGPIVDSAESKMPSEPKSKLERWKRSKQRNRPRL